MEKTAEMLMEERVDPITGVVPAVAQRPVARVHCFIQESGEVAVTGIVEERRGGIGLELWHPSDFSPDVLNDLRTAATLQAVQKKMRGLRGHHCVRLVINGLGRDQVRLKEEPDLRGWYRDVVMCAGQRSTYSCIARIPLMESATRDMVTACLPLANKSGITIRALGDDDLPNGRVQERLATVLIAAKSREQIVSIMRTLPHALRGLRPTLA